MLLLTASAGFRVPSDCAASPTEVLEITSDNELEVRLVTPPVTHSGHLDRLYRCTLEDIEDWQARDADGKLVGGFSQRAMFAIARRDGIKLPKRLLAHEREYRDV